jgi:pimeloyl-ACP methyl ester carboxylesterase
MKGSMKKLAVFVTVAAIALFVAAATASAGQVFAKDEDHILTIEHYVAHKSTVPAIAGQFVQLYVRERVWAGHAQNFRGAEATGKVVLFVHGATIPAETAFDLPYKDYSWMVYLAQAGFDVFLMDITGYGASTRPWQMNDKCNLSPADKAIIGFSTPCAPSYPDELGMMPADWDDMDSVVDYLRDLRGVDRISLIGWSLGGPRVGGYAVLHPEKVENLILYAPDTSGPTNSPSPVLGFAFTLVSPISWTDSCEGATDPGIFNALNQDLLESDPVGATWGPGRARAPIYPTAGALAPEIKAPTLVIVGEGDPLLPLDKLVYGVLGTQDKVFMSVACTGHVMVWQTRHHTLLEASKEWLLHQSIRGISHGVINVDPQGGFTLLPE